MVELIFCNFTLGSVFTRLKTDRRHTRERATADSVEIRKNYFCIRTDKELLINSGKIDTFGKMSGMNDVQGHRKPRAES